MTTWSETSIARALALQVFNRSHLVVVPNCGWTGYECDLLVVSQKLLIIDVEIKISRADFKADAGKDKWWHSTGYGEYQVIDGKRRYVAPPKVHRDWPPKVWKHYYCMPADIWKPDMEQFAASTRSGVILLREQPSHRGSPPMITAGVERRCSPNRDAKPISAANAVDIARLASLRMWSTYEAMDRQKSDHKKQLALRDGVAA